MRKFKFVSKDLWKDLGGHVGTMYKCINYEHSVYYRNIDSFFFTLAPGAHEIYAFKQMAFD